MKPTRMRRRYTVGNARNPWVAVTLVSVLALLVGCARIPEKELNAYISSVGEAREAGLTMLADWRSAREEWDRRTSTTPPPIAGAIPLTIELLSEDTVSDEGARVQAWEAIALYTEALARLQAGESVSDVKKTTGRLLQLAVRISGSAVPGLSELGTLLQEAAAAIEKARLAAEFKKAIHDGAPIIRRIINEVLLKDAGSHYTLRATLQAEDHAAVAVDEESDDVQKQLRQARIVDENNALRTSVVAYAMLLQQTDRSLQALERETSRPVDLAEQAERLMAIASTLKQHWLAYENTRREGRN